MNLATETVFTGTNDPPDHPNPAPAELAPHFPQLEVLECLGRGGMGVVYKARQKSLNRLVALKLLAPERARDPSFADRFAREAHALAALNHPHIVGVHDFGQAGGFYFLLMEFVDGVNLRQAMQAGRFTPEQALAVVPPVCQALQYAHDHGIVHRDIKPENLLLDKAGRVKIADFGIAKMLHVEGADVGLSASQPAGTPQYMAPEQLTPGQADHRADIYSLGVVLYEMLTGEMPGAKLQPPSRKVEIDVRLDEIVLRALDAKPELRYQTADEMRTQVETVVADPARSRRPSQPVKAGLGILTTPERLATAAGQFLLYRTRGQLLLHEGRLTHLHEGADTVISLASIRSLSIGKLPRAVNPLGLNVLSLGYEEEGRLKTILLAPMKGWFAFPGTHNDHVAQWFNAIREAVAATTGSAPVRVPADKLEIPPSNPALLAAQGAFLLAALCLLVILLNRPESPTLEIRPAPGQLHPQGYGVRTLLAWTALALGACFAVWYAATRSPSAAASRTQPRFARAAIVGACWAPFFLIALFAIYFSRSVPQPGLAWWQVAPVWHMALTAGSVLLGASAPFGTTILGWIAVSQIRQSAGRLHGLGMAVFDALLFPLLALDAMIFLAITSRGRVSGNPNWDPSPLAYNDPSLVGWPAIAAVLIILGVDFLIIRAVWRSVQPARS